MNDQGASPSHWFARGGRDQLRAMLEKCLADTATGWPVTIHAHAHGAPCSSGCLTLADRAEVAAALLAPRSARPSGSR